MKHAKSSLSLHSQPAQALKEQPLNCATLSIWKSTLRPVGPFRKEYNSVYNARGRLNTLRDFTGQLQEQTHAALVANKELKLQLAFMREQYLERTMAEVEAELQGRIKELRKKVTIGQRSDLLKYDSIQNIFDGLAKNHKELRGKLQEVEQRVKQLEDVMGTQPVPQLG